MRLNWQPVSDSRVKQEDNQHNASVSLQRLQVGPISIYRVGESLNGITDWRYFIWSARAKIYFWLVEAFWASIR